MYRAAFTYYPQLEYTPGEFIQIACSMLWMVLKCVQVLVSTKAHAKYMCKNFHGWSGRLGDGKAVQGWISGLPNTCYILPLKTLITVFISFLCNLFSFMVELTQVSRVQWFNAHVSFTCLVKHSKAPPLSKDVGVSGIPVNRGVLLIPIYNLHFLSCVLVFQHKALFERYPCNHSLKTGFMYYTCITYSCKHMSVPHV